VKILKFFTALVIVFILCGFSSKEDETLSPKTQGFNFSERNPTSKDGVLARRDKLIAAKVTVRIEIPTWYHEGLYFDGKNIWVANGIKGKIWVVDLAAGKVIREINPAGTFTEAMTSTEKYPYILTDWDIKKIYTARLEDNIMSVEKEVSLEPAHPTGTVWNGKNLFVLSWTRSLTGTKFHLLKMDSDFNILKSYKIDKIQEPCQMAWDGRNLWVSSWFENRIYKIDVDTLDVLGYFKSPVKNTTGVAWDGAHLWVTGTYSDLYKIELQN